MAKPLWFVIGLAVAIVGLIWTLQGIGVIGGSPMSNAPPWSVVGPIVVLGGLALAYVGFRGRRS